MPNNGIAMLSGGTDSTVMLYWLARNQVQHGLDAPPKLVVFFNCGYAVSDVAEKWCRHHCDLLHVPFLSIPLPYWQKGRLAKGRAPEKAVDIDLSKQKGMRFWNDTFDYNNARGMFFLSHMAYLAVEHKCRYIFLAHQQEDNDRNPPDGQKESDIYVDTGPSFVDAMQEAVDYGGVLKDVAPVYRTPFIDNRMSKRHIVALGTELGVDFSKTTSCDYGYPACGKCDGCRRRLKAFKDCGQKDPTAYKGKSK